MPPAPAAPPRLAPRLRDTERRVEEADGNDPNQIHLVGRDHSSHQRDEEQTQRRRAPPARSPSAVRLRSAEYAGDRATSRRTSISSPSSAAGCTRATRATAELSAPTRIGPSWRAGWRDDAPRSNPGNGRRARLGIMLPSHRTPARVTPGLHEALHCHSLLQRSEDDP